MFYQEVIFGIYETQEYFDKLVEEDLEQLFFNLLKKLNVVAVWNLVIFAIAILYLLTSMLALTLYYKKMRLPIDTHRLFDPLKFYKKRKPIKGCMKVLDKFQWSYVLVVFSLTCGYVALVLVWALFGAILNPTAYLYYASPQ